MACTSTGTTAKEIIPVHFTRCIKKTNFTNISRSWTAAHTVFKVNITLHHTGLAVGEAFPTAVLPSKGSPWWIQEPFPSPIPRTAAGGTPGDLETGLPTRKTEMCPQWGNLDRHWGFSWCLGVQAAPIFVLLPINEHWAAQTVKFCLYCLCRVTPLLFQDPGPTALSGTQISEPLWPHPRNSPLSTPHPPNQPYLLHLSFHLTTLSVQTGDQCLENPE